jgi:copper(I)-binding protein
MKQEMEVPMNINPRTPILALAVIALMAFGLTGCGEEKQTETAQQGVTIETPWARTSPANQQNGAVYMKIESDSPDKLIKAEVESSIADHAELHETSMETDGGGMDDSMHGKMSMKKVPFIEAPAELKPGGFHIMLIGLKQPIKNGGEIELTLTFEKEGELRVTAVGRD